MKVKFEEHYKNFYTVRDYEQAKAVIACEKDDSFTAKDWAEYAVNTLCSARGWSSDHVLEASARTCKNAHIRERNMYGDDTGIMDIAIEATARIWGDFGNGWNYGYIEIISHLSDIMQVGNEELFNASHVTYWLYK